MKKEKQCKGLTFADCELSILRMAVDKAEEKMKKRVVHSEEVQRIIDIVEDFIRQNKLICYGGTAINNILPEQDRFYNKDVEIPDYDFFSVNAMEDAKKLADIYYKKGFIDVEAKAGQHHGTYKVYVNYIPVADITYIPKQIFDALLQDAIKIDKIHYAPPNFLRMSMYLELSRPAGDTSRWEKVLKRLSLLNKNYPITGEDCNKIDFQREMADKTNEEGIFKTVQNTLINQGVVFFGAFANTLYSKYMPKHLRQKLEDFADFDVLSNDPDKTAEIVKERLQDIGIKNIKIIKREPVGEIIPEHYEVKINKDTIVFIYKTIGCHSYNIEKIHGKKAKIATIDTMLSFYLAFLYANQPYYNQFINRILCMSKYLFDVQQQNRLAQKGLLKRFSIICYGHQSSIEEIKANKAEKYKELKQLNNKSKFDEWFLNYKPDDLNKKYLNKLTKTKKEKAKKQSKNKTERKKQSNNWLNIYSKKRKTKKGKGKLEIY